MGTSKERGTGRRRVARGETPSNLQSRNRERGGLVPAGAGSFTPIRGLETGMGKGRKIGKSSKPSLSGWW